MFILECLECNKLTGRNSPRAYNGDRLLSQTRSRTTATVQWTPPRTDARRRKCKRVRDSCRSAVVCSGIRTVITGPPTQCRGAD